MAKRYPVLRVLMLLLAACVSDVRRAAAHEPDGVSIPIADKEKLAAPCLPTTFPRRRPIDAGIAMHPEIDDALHLTVEYRRLMDYFLVVAETRGLVAHSISDELVRKMLQLLDHFENYALEMNVALTGIEKMGGASATKSRSERLGGFAKNFRALRTELDHQIRKHYEYLAIPRVSVTKTGIICDRKAIRLKALAGSQSAIFILFDETNERGTWTVRLHSTAESAADEHPISLRASQEGLVPLSMDQIVRDAGKNRSVVITYQPADSQKSPLSFTLPLDIEVIQPSWVELEVNDGKTAQALACRLQVNDRYGNSHAPLGARVTEVPRPFGQREWNTNYRFPGESFFYGKQRVRVMLPPGPALVRALHGFEYEVYERQLNLGPGETARVQVPLKRWIDMPSRGWRCGQTHMHSRNLMPVNDDSDWQIVPEAEGLDISYLLTYQQAGEVFSDQYPIGPLTHLSRPDHQLSVGEEFRHFTRGHMTFNGLDRIVEPISTGMLRGPGQPESPSNAEAIHEAHRQGAIAAYAHLNSMGGLITSEELPIDAALGLVDAGEVMGAGGGYQYWYPMLNCGIRMGATAGPDWDLEDCCRVYVHLGEKEFTEKNWLDALRKHHTFVTTGPMLFLTVNGQGPGSVISGKDAGKLEIRAQALSNYPIEKLELIVNAKVIATKTPGADKRTLQLEMPYRPERNGWIAARCFGKGNAHTSAVYIELNDKPVDAVEDAALLRGIAAKALQQAERSRNYPTPAAKQKVLELYRQGVAYYDEIIERDRKAKKNSAK